jgi:hypothetical protein
MHSIFENIFLLCRERFLEILWQILNHYPKFSLALTQQLINLWSDAKFEYLINIAKDLLLSVYSLS